MSTDSVDVIKTVLEALAGGSSDVTIIIVSSADEAAEGETDEGKYPQDPNDPYAMFRELDRRNITSVTGGGGGTQPALLLE